MRMINPLKIHGSLHRSIPHLDIAPWYVSLATTRQLSLQPVVINAVEQVKKVPLLEGQLPVGLGTRRKYSRNITKMWSDINANVSYVIKISQHSK